MSKANQSEETVEEEDVESDDSSEEETEEDTEDSKSESDDDESSDDESEEEEKEEQPVEKFLDVAKLPKELLPLGKKMQASFTKKMQGLKKELDDRQMELSQRYARSIKAEKALSVLSENESFKKFLADARDNRPYGYTSVYNKGTTEKEEESSSNGDGQITVNGLMKQLTPLINQAIAKAVEPVLQDHSRMTQTQIKKNLPNFSKYELEVTELMENEGLSLQRAYEIASQKDRIADAISAAVKTGKKDIKRIPRTEGKTSAGSSELKAKPAKDIREALNFAFSQTGD